MPRPLQCDVHSECVLVLHLTVRHGEFDGCPLLQLFLEARVTDLLWPAIYFLANLIDVGTPPRTSRIYDVEVAPIIELNAGTFLGLYFLSPHRTHERERADGPKQHPLHCRPFLWPAWPRLFELLANYKLRL